jgi:hypothetical protein
MMKTNHIQWLALAVLLLLTAGCPVDVNTAKPDGGDDGGDPECPKTELATVRFFHAAGGTPVTRPEFGPATTRNLNVVRMDSADELVVVTSLVAGRASIVQLCGNKMLTLGARLSGADEDRATMMIMLTPDADASLFDVGTTIVLAGIADALKEDGVTPENPASVGNALQFITVKDTFSTGAETQMQVVHASRQTPTPIDVELNPDSTGPDVPGLVRYAFSGVQPTKGTADTAPSAVPVTFLQAAVAKASFTIAPRMPAGAKGLAIHFDTEVFDPDHPDPTKRSPAPKPQLFLTGDDPLLGLVAGGGITF